jgi:hypothetical protein
MYQEDKIDVEYFINRNQYVPLNPTSLIIVIPASVTVQISRLSFLVLFTDWMKLKCRFFYAAHKNKIHYAEFLNEK